MLDQNTDRMWYVIGAVIIGAAIIFIMNNTFPQLFASVGDTFTGKVGQTTEIVDGIGPVARPTNLLDGVSVDFAYLNLDTGAYMGQASTTDKLDRTTDFIDVRGMSHVTISMHDVITVDFSYHNGIVWGYDENKEPVSLLARNIKWKEPGSMVVDVSKVSYIRANLILQDEYRYKIEDGTVVTPYE